MQARIRAERLGLPFLTYQDADFRERIFPLDGRETVTVGRGEGNDLALDHEPQVSHVHAELSRLGTAWTVEDDGLSRNGTFVNEQRIVGRRRLHDGDLVRMGRATLRFCDPAERERSETKIDVAFAIAPPSEAQRRVLVALCRPLAGGEPGATPATNRQIADELVVSVDAVKTHIRALCAKFDVGDVGQNSKRALLAQRALDSGVVSPRELA